MSNPPASDRADYDLYGLLAIRVDGAQTPMGRALHGDLGLFHRTGGGADLALSLGGPASMDRQDGVALGDGLRADPAGARICVAESGRSGRVRYEVHGDPRGTGPVSVVVPHLRRDHTAFTRSWRALVRGDLFRRPAEQASEISAEILEPFLQLRLARHGHAFVHAAAVGVRRALLLTGASNVGKTLLSLRLVARGLGFLGDDLALVRADGTVLAYPKRVNLERQDLVAAPGLVAALTTGLTRLEAWRLRRRLTTRAALPHGLGRLPVSDFAPLLHVSPPLPLGGVVHLRRDADGATTLTESDPATSAARVASNAFWEFEHQPWRRPAQLLALDFARQQDPHAESAAHHARVHAILSTACAGARSYDLRLPATLDERSIERAVELLAPLA